MRKLAVKDTFRDPVVIHADHVAGPSKLSCYQECLYAIDLAAFEDGGIGGYVLPFSVSKLSEIAHHSP